MTIRRIFVTGGAGYVGAALVPELLRRGHAVTVFDLMMYGGEVLDSHYRLKTVKGDIRDVQLLRQVIPGHDSVIHLACISNDPSFDLNPELGRSVNLDAFSPLVNISRSSEVTRFIYASSSSVYGVSEEPVVHEEVPLAPLTDYSRFKANCEKILHEHVSDDFCAVTLRPATVCGYSRRQRLDVVVNIFSNLAYHNRKINIFGGTQIRPNIHIADMVAAYLAVLDAPSGTINGRIYNVGHENHSVLDLAKTVQEVMGDDVALQVVPTKDPRSYRISSELIAAEIGFRANRSIKEAVEDLREAFVGGLLPNSLTDERYFNIRRMQALGEDLI